MVAPLETGGCAVVLPKMISLVGSVVAPLEIGGCAVELPDEDCIDDALCRAIVATAKSPAEARFLESIIKQLDVRKTGKRIKISVDGEPAIPINIFIAEDDGPILMNDGEQEWEDVEFEVALDSGSIVNVCHEDDAPGYLLQESPGSRRGQNFVVGDGGKLPNQGEK